LIVVSSFGVNGFASGGNLQNVISVAVPFLIVALGQMLVMICGGIDLSLTTIMAFTSVAGATLITGDGGWLGGTIWAVPVVCLAMPVVGGLVGLVNGLSVSYLRMPPFIATLTSMMFLYGVSTWWTQSKNIGSLPLSFIQWGTSERMLLCLAVFLSMLDNVLNLLSLSYFAIGIAKGLLILMAALLDSLRHRWSTS